MAVAVAAPAAIASALLAASAGLWGFGGAASVQERRIEPMPNCVVTDRLRYGSQVLEVQRDRL